MMKKEKIIIIILTILLIICIGFLGVILHYYLMYRSSYSELAENFSRLGNAVVESGASIEWKTPGDFSSVYIELPSEK